MRWMDAVGIASGCGGSDAIDAINNAKNDAKLFAIILRSGLLEIFFLPLTAVDLGSVIFGR